MQKKYLYLQLITVEAIRNEAGELLDEQITCVPVELDKLRLSAEEINTDLEKLVYTMKTIQSHHCVVGQPHHTRREKMFQPGHPVCQGRGQPRYDVTTLSTTTSKAGKTRSSRLSLRVRNAPDPSSSGNQNSKKR